MRNLSPLVCSNVSIAKCDDCDVHLAVDSDTGRIYFNTKTDLIGVDPAFHEETFSIGLEELSDHAVKVMGIQFLQGEESLCICSQEGDLLVVNVHTKTVENVGSVESGLTAMCWSPDQELLLLLTAHETVIAMTREFDPISEVSIHAKEFGEGQFINVGWGKKETQFHGSEGKGAAIKKEEATQTALPWDDRKTRIVWRGDGQFFGVHLIDPERGNRIFRVWNRECVLQYTSEYMPGLESAFAWRPSGNLLASSQRKPHQHDIVFFEKNGLQHGEFTLPFDKDTMNVKHLEWSSDSSILLVWLTPLKNDPTTHDQVLLWTVSNYHWYLKQNLLFAFDKSPVCVQWDSESSHKLHIICKDGTYKQYVFMKNICHSNSPLPHKIHGKEESTSTVAVIDGKNILMTPFKTMIVPPPMCAYKLELPSQANSVMFCSSPSALNDVAVVLKTEDVAIYSTQHHTQSKSEEIQSKLSVKLDGAGGIGFSSRAKLHTPISILKIKIDCPDVIDISGLHHWVWLNMKQMFAISPGILPSTAYAVLFEIDFDNSTISAKQSCTVDDVLLSAHVISDDCIVLQKQDGRMLKCHIPTLAMTDYLLPNGIALKLPRPCHQVINCTFNGQDCVVGLSEHSRLYINDTEIASDCSSFCLHNDFLFLTTHTHQLKCISRNVPLQDVLKYYSTPVDGRSLLDNCTVIENHRVVERGSRIVTVTPFDSKLILQMPRGNLELIHPRCLVLSLVNRLIRNLEYGKAFAIMKKHRINMNLLYDINKKLFEDNVKKFVEQLGSTSNINIFISDLQNDDLTTTMYKQYCFSKSNTSDVRDDIAMSKVNIVCDMLIVELKKSTRNFLTSIVTAHVKKQPTEVGPALMKIKTLADTIGLEEKIVSDTLKYMTILVDGNTLFNEALGTYDFKLVLMVAEKSQLDPKEFLPMLKELQELDDNYRKYKIDMKLKRYSTALEHISKCDDKFTECMDLINEHELYGEAMTLFNEGSIKYNTICKSYAKHLASKNKYEEAGGMYSRCYELRKAMDSFSNSTNYLITMSIAYKMKLCQEEIAQMAHKVADRAKSRGDYRDAVEILEYHAQDVEGALEAALTGQMWARAICVAEKYEKSDLIEAKVIPSIKNAYEQTCHILESNRDMFLKHSKRLQTVRDLKEKQRLQALLDGVDGIDSDMYSDASSTITGSVSSRASTTATRETGRTSKSRKKKERKIYSLKEGSKFEEIALLHSLKSTISAVDLISDDVVSLVSHLSLLRLDDLARKLQTLNRNVRTTIGRLIATIWCQSVFENQHLAIGPMSTTNSIVSAMHKNHSVPQDSQSILPDRSLFIPPKFDA